MKIDCKFCLNFGAMGELESSQLWSFAELESAIFPFPLIHQYNSSIFYPFLISHHKYNSIKF